MSQETKKRLLDHLSGLERGAREKLIVTLKEVSDEIAEAPSPDDYESRQAYRKALIEHAASKTKDTARQAISRLKETGVSIWTGPLSTILIVEGTPDELSRVLEHDDVADASLDEDIELIRPVNTDPSATSQ